MTQMKSGTVLGDTTQRDLLRGPAETGSLAAPVTDPAHQIEAIISASLPQGTPAVHVQSYELHLIEGVSTLDLGRGPVEVVAFPPEFLYAVDVGKSARAGVSVFWNTGRGLGDPAFPDFTDTKLRTIYGTNASDLIFPFVVGELLISLKTGSDPSAAKRDLESVGLQAVNVIAPNLLEARCVPFEERAFASRLPSLVASVSHAELNRVVRLIDFSPGWRVRRIA